MEKQHQAVGHPLTGPHDEDVEVNSDGDGPEKGAAVGESGYRPLDGAVQRVGAEKSADSEGVGGGGQPVRDREAQQQRPGGRPQVRPEDEGEDDERGAHKRQRTRRQDEHLLRKVHQRLVPGLHRSCDKAPHLCEGLNIRGGFGHVTGPTSPELDFPAGPGRLSGAF